MKNLTASALLLLIFSTIFNSANSQTPGNGQQGSNASKSSQQNQIVVPDHKKNRTSEFGWWFYEEEKKDDTDEPSMPKQKLPSELPPAPKDDKCKKKDTWSPSCGFVNPGSDFAFQEKQRDALVQQMSMSNNDPKAVEAFQYYMRWVLERTSEVSNLWWYNMVQNPELDPTAAAPVSTFGLRLMTDVKTGKKKEVFDLIKEENGMFVYFSRSDCNFCHQMSPIVKKLSENTKIPLRNASLDNKCLPGMEQGCVTQSGSLKPAEALQVTVVPSLFLFVAPNTWLRLSTGVSDYQSIEMRAMQFFSAYRNALLKGVENGISGRPSVDFSNTEVNGLSKGIATPKQSDIEKMLGK